MSADARSYFVPFSAKPRCGRRSARVGWITDENGCDIWQAARNVGGYGLVCIDSQMRVAHRVRYEREIGPIPEGMDLDHFVCDNGGGGCCNPRHCRPVTPRENTLRGNTLAAINAAKTHCPKGHPYSERKSQRRCVACMRVWSTNSRLTKRAGRGRV